MNGRELAMRHFRAAPDLPVLFTRDTLRTLVHHGGLDVGMPTPNQAFQSKKRWPRKYAWHSVKRDHEPVQVDSEPASCKT
jgi:hypothetical protein